MSQLYGIKNCIAEVAIGFRFRGAFFILAFGAVVKVASSNDLPKSHLPSQQMKSTYIIDFQSPASSVSSAASSFAFHVERILEFQCSLIPCGFVNNILMKFKKNLRCK